MDYSEANVLKYRIMKKKFVYMKILRYFCAL
jgi:hypothetical protein